MPAEFVRYASGGAIVDDIGTGRWDVTFFAVDPARTDRLTFSRPIAQIEATFAVLDGSPLTHADQADRTGLTIATARNAAYELHLKRTVAHAVITSHDTPAAALSPCFRVDATSQREFGTPLRTRLRRTRNSGSWREPSL